MWQYGVQVQERRAMRGLAASARLQGQYKSAIKHLERVLEISKAMKEFTGKERYPVVALLTTAIMVGKQTA
jgi:hypothetical protein